MIKMNQILKQKLQRWPRFFLFLVVLKRSPSWFWNKLGAWRQLVPYRWRRYPDVTFYGFHGDRVLRELVSEIIEEFRPTALVETGTHKTTTTLFLAKLASTRMPIYTCEISGPYFRESRWRLHKAPGVIIQQLSSPVFVNRLVKQKALGERPFFFLDAHSGGNVPLQEELRALSSLQQAIVIIDDFVVPERSDFGHDVYEYALGKVRSYDLEFISPALNAQHDYQVFFPQYTAQEAFGNNFINDGLRGYLVLLVNLRSELQRAHAAG
ncbi:MAG: hypothetical protein HY093_04315 [Candidatus Liptonbacteria bacterium]|nr:hypothetical protein [Candidatus Liptonbacteria bacterium]